ncbi:hypothetical protein EVAR_84145_1 [Eumeta japonica]|uniref:Uncharacterized protein n=1 Tax=Eumeta variegata TaxID=151549 RepID=A0A4C2AAP0_EUMVA|nr:hypothetical protein EVAR_84145_1 [Eumeta japonica]
MGQRVIARPSPPERPCRRDRVVASSTTSPYRPATRQGRSDFAFDAATVGKCAADDGETSTVWGRGLDARTRSRARARREQPREDERGAGHCTVSPACLQSDAALDSVEHLRTPSFLVAGAQAHEAYRTIGSITVMYGPHDLRTQTPRRLGCSG